MSNSYGSATPTGSQPADGEEPSTINAAKTEATDLKDTAVEQASTVAHSIQGEASSVMGEATSQARQLYAQTQRELRDQADAQQQRVASGLRTMGSELESMSDNAPQQGVAADLVRQVAERLSGAASWLGERDPASVLEEVKRYARRKPGTFIAVAAIAGVVAGRLTRALAANASDASDQPGASRADASATASATPLFDQSTTRGGALSGEGARDVRSDTV
ncbi:hypothetical protein ACFVR6_05780 [Microbacterium sp. NPDC058021]|uniref:hypothetical protein n=1 Tax=Microbacterium sp. NPDC058021 TaxID=3346306 RepID=UPI0036DE902A